eukprot:TRINITY_DN2698_c0_g1_i8.p2 TRINITY_DN2698_c0_g1~~TRINITY_DN2698_c0_g1_i8.p2  ORF type:complete len:209 (+),score=18.38 TRINITY_DN2698_c0_g1_i8:484-1110(+)
MEHFLHPEPMQAGQGLRWKSFPSHMISPRPAQMGQTSSPCPSHLRQYSKSKCADPGLRFLSRVAIPATATAAVIITPEGPLMGRLIRRGCAATVDLVIILAPFLVKRLERDAMSDPDCTDGADDDRQIVLFDLPLLTLSLGEELLCVHATSPWQSNSSFLLVVPSMDSLAPVVSRITFSKSSSAGECFTNLVSSSMHSDRNERAPAPA